MKRYLQIGILTALMWILFPLILQAAPVGKVTAIEGKVDLTVSGKEAKDVTPGDAVNVGDIIRTKSKSKCEVTFIDGNILRLAESTRIEVSEYMIENDKRRETIGLLRGKIRSIVQKGLHALGTEQGGHYEVRTPTAVLGVRGSDVINFHQNGISGGIFNSGNGYGYPLGNPQYSQNYGQGQGLTILGANLRPILQLINQQQLNQHNQDTNLGGSGGATTTATTTTATTAATTVAPSGSPSGTSTETTISGTSAATTAATTVATTVGPGGGAWTGTGLGTGGLLPTTVILPPTTMEPITSIAPLTTVLPVTTIIPTTVLPTTTTTTTVATTTSTSTSTTQSTTTTTVLPTTTTTTTTVATTTSSTTSTTSTSTTSTTTTSIPPNAVPINGNITGLFTNPAAISGYVFNTGAAGSVTVNGTDTVPGNPWPIAGFAGNYGAGGGTFDGYFAGFTGSWDGLYHAIYFDDGLAGYTWGGMSDAGTVFTGTGPTYGGTTMGTAVGTTLTAWTKPLPRFGNIEILGGKATFAPPDGTYNSAVKGVDLLSGQKMGVWGSTSTDSTFSTDGSASWNGVFFQGDSNYQMVGRVYGSTSETPSFWSIGPSGGGDPSALYYLDDTHLGKLILNYRAKGVSGAYVLAGAGSFFLDPLLYASTLNVPVFTGPQNLDTLGRMGVANTPAGVPIVYFLGTSSALVDQSVWMNSFWDATRNAGGTIVGFKQMGTNTGGGDFGHQGVLYGLYANGSDFGYLKAVTTDAYNGDTFKMTSSGALEQASMGLSGINVFGSEPQISGTGGYAKGLFERITGQNWGFFSSYLTGTSWPLEFVAEADNGNLFHKLNLDTGGTSPPSAPPGSPGGSMIGAMPVAGAWMNINEAMTGVSGGQLFSQGPASGWQAVAAGGWIETNRFISMLSSAPNVLDMLNIPRNPIGSVALTGNNLYTNVSMTAYFYGYSSGPPRIFVSDNVTGSTTMNPIGTTVILGGPGFYSNVNFTFTNWNMSTNKWAATVNTTSTGQIGGFSTHMKGYSAGGFIPSASTTFNGTAAGVAVPLGGS